MRRPGPRPLAIALDRFAAEHAPASTLAQVQACWPAVAGPALAAEAEPVSERDGTVTFPARSAVWAQELDLLSPDLLERLNAALGDGRGETPLRRLRFVAGGLRRRV